MKAGSCHLKIVNDNDISLGGIGPYVQVLICKIYH